MLASRFGMSLRIDRGVIPCFLLYSVCFIRRRSISERARFIEPVSWSAYMRTRLFTLRAARPQVWMRLVSERK